MKFLSALLLGLFLAVSALAEVGPVNRRITTDGTNTVKGANEKFFIGAVNGTGSSVSNGRLVFPDTTSDDGYTFATSSTAGAFPLCILDEACAASKACRCQTYGLKTDVSFDSTNGTASAGGLVFMSENNAGYVQAETTGNQAAFDQVVGVFYDTTSASGDVEVFIRLR